jgi:hypothetical protein
MFAPRSPRSRHAWESRSGMTVSHPGSRALDKSPPLRPYSCVDHQFERHSLPWPYQFLQSVKDSAMPAKPCYLVDVTTRDTCGLPAGAATGRCRRLWRLPTFSPEDVRHPDWAAPSNGRQCHADLPQRAMGSAKMFYDLILGVGRSVAETRRSLPELGPLSYT